ncbi:hypothetical protein [Streptomyces sp. NWU49]|uniref:hypothetical protein n=1 Tax=Streptomyces sp. NWU49 TaxID=2201153 RepID=UPI0035C159EC
MAPRHAPGVRGPGGTVLCTTADPKEAARTGDRVVALERGRAVADQEAGDFSHTHLRPRVAVRGPHAVRLSALLAKEARTARRSVEVVPEGGNRLCVYGSTRAEVGETAFRHGTVVHRLAARWEAWGPERTSPTRPGPPVMTRGPGPVTRNVPPADRRLPPSADRRSRPSAHRRPQPWTPRRPPRRKHLSTPPPSRRPPRQPLRNTRRTTGDRRPPPSRRPAAPHRRSGR